MRHNDHSHHFGFTQARRDFSAIYSSTQGGDVAVVERRHSEPVALVKASLLRKLLAEACPFNVQVSRQEGQVSMWIEGLPVHATGSDIDSAAEELVAALIDYVDIWETELRYAPNHRDNDGWIQQVQMAAGVEDVHSLLFD